MRVDVQLVQEGGLLVHRCKDQADALQLIKIFLDDINIGAGHDSRGPIDIVQLNGRELHAVIIKPYPAELAEDTDVADQDGPRASRPGG